MYYEYYSNLQIWINSFLRQGHYFSIFHAVYEEKLNKWDQKNLRTEMHSRHLKLLSLNPKHTAVLTAYWNPPAHLPDSDLVELELGHPNIASHPQKTGKKKKLLVLISQKPDTNVIFIKALPLSDCESSAISLWSSTVNTS